MYRDSDLTAIETGDEATQRDVGARLGIDLAPLPELAALMRRARAAVRQRDAIATLLDAATGDSGIAMFQWERWLCVAIRIDAQVTFGFGSGKRVSKVWPSLEPWEKFAPANRKRLEQWASEGGTDRVVFELTPIATTPTTPPNAEALMRELAERPDDKELRSVLADHLIEHDDPRGKLMRLAAEIEVLPAHSDDRRKRELVVERLLEAHSRRLAGEIADYASTYELAGGLVNSVTMTAAAFRDHGARLFALQPIRGLTLAPSNTEALTTLTTGPVGVLRELYLRCSDSQRVELSALAGASFDRLEVLVIGGVAPIDQPDAFKGWIAPRLRSLRFMTYISFAALRGATFDALEELTLLGTRLGRERLVSMEMPLDELELPKLRTLRLDRDYATDECLARIRARGIEVVFPNQLLQ